jgi:hypothetical protein
MFYPRAFSTTNDMSANKYLPVEYRKYYDGSRISMKGFSEKERNEFFNWICTLDDNVFKELGSIFDVDEFESTLIACNVSKLGKSFMSMYNMGCDKLVVGGGMLNELRFLFVWFMIYHKEQIHEIIIDDTESTNPTPLWLTLGTFNVSYTACVVRQMKNCQRGPIYYGSIYDAPLAYSNVCCCKYCLECFMLVHAFCFPISDITIVIQQLYFRCKRYL